MKLSEAMRSITRAKVKKIPVGTKVNGKTFDEDKGMVAGQLIYVLRFPKLYPDDKQEWYHGHVNKNYLLQHPEYVPSFHKSWLDFNIDSTGEMF